MKNIVLGLLALVCLFGNDIIVQAVQESFQHVQKLIQDRVELKWNTYSDGIVEMKVEAKLERGGWIGIGLGTQMYDSRVILGFTAPSIKHGYSPIGEYHINSDNRTRQAVVPVYGANGILDSSIEQANGLTSLYIKADSIASKQFNIGQKDNMVLAFGAFELLSDHGTTNRVAFTMDWGEPIRVGASAGAIVGGIIAALVVIAAGFYIYKKRYSGGMVEMDGAELPPLDVEEQKGRYVTQI